MKIPEHTNNAIVEKPQKKGSRKFQRIRAIKDVTIGLDIDDNFLRLPLVDISQGGIRIKSDKIFTPGATITLKLTPNDLIKGKVKWVKRISEEHSDYDIGIEFKEEWAGDINTIAGFRAFERKKPAPDKRLNIEIWGKEDVGRYRELVSIYDMSEGGIKIKSSKPLKVGRVVNLKLSKNKTVSGLVRWCSQSDNPLEFTFFIGIQFIDEERDWEKTEKDSGPKGKKPRGVDYYNRLGIALRKKKKFEEALVSYEKALTIDPNNEILYFNMAKVHISMKDKKKALEALETSLRKDPDFLEAKGLLQEITKDT